jgi:hypothetical protein
MTKVYFITSEIFSGKRRGGFGKLVRVVGRELAKRGLMSPNLLA